MRLWRAAAVLGLLAGPAGALDRIGEGFARYVPAPAGCTRTASLHNERVVLHVGCSVEVRANMQIHEAGVDAHLVLEPATEASLFCGPRPDIGPDTPDAVVLASLRACLAQRSPPDARLGLEPGGLPLVVRETAPGSAEYVGAFIAAHGALKLTITVVRRDGSAQLQVTQLREDKIEDLLKGIDYRALKKAAGAL